MKFIEVGSKRWLYEEERVGYGFFQLMDDSHIIHDGRLLKRSTKYNDETCYIIRDGQVWQILKEAKILKDGTIQKASEPILTKVMDKYICIDGIAWEIRIPERYGDEFFQNDEGVWAYCGHTETLLEFTKEKLAEGEAGGAVENPARDA